MMLIKMLAGLAAILGGVLSLDASASKINPCLRVLTYSNGALSEEPINWWNACPYGPKELKAAVHEHMTNFAISKYRGKNPFDSRTSKFSYMHEGPWSKEGGAQEHQTHVLIYGTWWNDDPLMYLQGEGRDFRAGVRKLHTIFQKHKRRKYAGGIADCLVPAAQHLTRWSHFGPLQHLHFMTTLDSRRSADERVDDTRDRALVWIEFAYKVAIGEIKPTDDLTDPDEKRLSLPSIAVNLCLKDRSTQKVRSLFARIGSGSAANMAKRNKQTPDLALGSILHIIQDSFSPAHTCRVERLVDDQPQAVLRDVYNYNEQNHEEHGKRDGYPQWLLRYAKDGAHTYSNDPVAVGAWLLRAVDHKLKWESVREHLENTAFARALADESTGSKPCIGIL